jgi:signal transduction histidine kinase
MMSKTSNRVSRQMYADIHALCQPLTALQCRLEIGRMHGNETALQEAVDGSLAETRRMFEIISRMRRLLQLEVACSE